MKSRPPLVVASAVAILLTLPLLANPVSMGPQAMEGDLKVSPGTVLLVGYDFTIPGSHPAIDVKFQNTRVTFQAQCVSGFGGGTLNVDLADNRTTVPAKSGDWYPSGDQHAPAVFQGLTIVPDLCGGGRLTLRSGGTFSADLLASDTTRGVHVRWHYSANGSSGSWSGTTTFLPGPLGGGGGPS